MIPKNINLLIIIIFKKQIKCKLIDKKHKKSKESNEDVAEKYTNIFYLQIRDACSGKIINLIYFPFVAAPRRHAHGYSLAFLLFLLPYILWRF